MLKSASAYTSIFTQILAIEDQESRIRKALGLLRGPLPEIKAEWLSKYFRYLNDNLVFPFRARYTEELDPHQSPAIYSVEAFGLVDPTELRNLERTAILCRVLRNVKEEEVPLVDLEVDDGHPNFQLLEDYWYWIWNWRFDPKI